MKNYEQENGHSADVSMWMVVDGCSIPIAQMGPDFLIIRESVEFPPSDAEITLRVDGHEEHWAVKLPEGVRPGQTRTRVIKSEVS